MTIDNLVEKLETLTAQQRRVLELVCSGRDYEDIADELGLQKGTIQSHMGNIYLKLGLEDESRTRKRKALFTEICEEFENIDTASAQPDPPQPDPIPRKVRRLVKKDEKDLVHVSRVRVVKGKPLRRRNFIVRFFAGLFRLILRVVLVVLGVVVVGVVLLFILQGQPPDYEALLRGEGFDELIPQISSETGRDDNENQPEERIVVVTATSRPASATRRPTDAPPPTATLRPASTPRPTNTARPAPTQNVALRLDDWYTEGNVSISVGSDIDFSLGDLQKHPRIGLQILIRNVSDNVISFEYGNWNFILEDNQGERYAIYSGAFSQKLTLDPGEMEKLHGDLGNVRVFFAIDYTQTHITELTLTVQDLSSIGHTEWIIPIHH